MYKFTRLKPQSKAKLLKTSTGPVKGLNKLTAVELQDMSQAQILDNYFPKQQGSLEKSKGYTKIKGTSGVVAGTMLEKFDTGKYIYSYGTSIAYNNLGTISVLKSDFATSTSFSGVKYGEFFYTCNGGNKIGIFMPGTTYQFLTFSGGSGTNAIVGLTVSDDFSTSTGVIKYITYTSATEGVMVIGSIIIVGAGFNGGTITWTGGSATGSTLNGTFYEISNAPKAKFLFQSDGRLFAGDTDTSISEVKWSQKDTNFNEIPFLIWVASNIPLLATDAGSISYRSAGEVVGIKQLGSQLIVGLKDGKFGYRITTLDISGTGLSQTTTTDFQREDFGMERGFISTAKGVFYVNEAGLWQMTSGGYTNQPYSEQDYNISRILGEEFVNNIDFTDADLVFDTISNRIYCTCKEGGASFNNVLLWYDTLNKSFGRRRNIQISRFMKDGKDIYGISSIKTEIYKLFDGYEDNGETILSVIEQEIQLKLNTLYALDYTEIKGFFNQQSNISLEYDIYDRFGVKKTSYLSLNIELTTASNNILQGFNGIGFNGGGFNGFSETNTIELPAKKRTIIDEFSRIIIRIKSEDRFAHNITWLRFGIIELGENPSDYNLVSSETETGTGNLYIDGNGNNYIDQNSNNYID